MKILVTLSVLFLFSGCASTHNVEKSQLFKEMSYASPKVINTSNIKETQPKQKAIDISNINQKNVLKEYWLPLVKVDPPYPHRAMRKRQSRCLDIVFLINSSGQVSSYHVRNNDVNDAFVKNAARALTRWKWQASKTNPDKLSVITSTRINFDMSKTPSVDIFGECS